MLALQVLVLAVTASFPVLRLEILNSTLVQQYGARCLDGSAGGFYFAPATTAENRSKLVIFVQGGGECRTKEECDGWSGGMGSSSKGWPLSLAIEEDELSHSSQLNPDFHDWQKLFLPYCSADMHSGTRKTRSAALGGWYFAGHSLIAGSLKALAMLPDFVEPRLVLLSGSSAGGIGALLHADFISDHWPAASVKAAPACGFFYAAVSSFRDWNANESTPASKLGFISEWDPFIDETCSRATGGNVSACTDAHFALPHISTPLFVRENLYDTAKLGNCGLDTRGPISDAGLHYLRQWGRWMRAQLGAIHGMAGKGTTGYFAPSCLEHGSNLRFSTAPLISGLSLQEALSAWFFQSAKGGKPPPRLMDDVVTFRVRWQAEASAHTCSLTR
eukprot:CAMPEP_0119326424 /NCGR_PEP_ID=MMETSP1333-20130426/68363_1 /TAXON_ID=418940 /ORGANISM="Scyphosphaera apsteinii, Strain RCC1455" /LENGTH=388 /DNA_ID=CAMNT_0007334731 /DNA_START=27 /DNA_END=1194 /DNA_ORIENTATION=-